MSTEQNHPIDFSNHYCLICKDEGRKFPCRTMRTLGNHLIKKHEIHTKDYVIAFFYNNTVPLCACDCGKEVAWNVRRFEYRKFASGHNSRLHNTNKPLTEEKKRLRLERFRSSYASVRDSVSEHNRKISTERFKDPAERQKLSDGQKRHWDTPGAREQASIDRKRVWDENYEENYAKIFTPEWGKKISKANQEREYSRTSQEEIRFLDRLRDVFGKENIVSPTWINTEERAVSPDCYIISEKLYVEWDGVYFHGLDRKENFNLSQLKHLTNDLQKNRIMKELKYNYVRVASDCDISTINNKEDLLNAGYHLQLEDQLIKNGSFFLKGDIIFIPKDKLEELVKRMEDKKPKFFERTVIPLIEDFVNQHILYWNSCSKTAKEIIETLRVLPDVITVQRGNIS